MWIVERHPAGGWVLVIAVAGLPLLDAWRRACDLAGWGGEEGFLLAAQLPPKAIGIRA